MAEEQKGMTLNAMLAIAAAIGVVVLAVLRLLVGYGFFGALVLGVIAGLIVFLVLYYGFGAMHPGATADGSAGHVAAAAPSGTAPEAVSGAKASSRESVAKAPSDPAEDAIDSTGAAAGPDSTVGTDARPTREEVAENVSRGMAAGPSQTAAAASAATGAAERAAEDAPQEGTRPEALSAPREGGPDNLKEIKGVGPKLETLLHDLGIYHFDQIAGWGAAEIAWMDGNLKGFRGRVSRDGWVEQAKLLAAGGETEFSKKVGKGGVY